MTPTKAPSSKFIKINLNPRIALLAIRYGLKKVRSAGERWIGIWIELRQRFGQDILLYFRLAVCARQNKTVMCFWGDLNGLPGKQNKGMVVEPASIMNANFSNPKRQVFRLVDKREAKDRTTIIWIADAARPDTEWESLLYDGKPKPDEVFYPGNWIRHVQHAFKSLLQSRPN